MNLKDDDILRNLINACLKGKRKDQKKLHKALYGQLMAICLRYGKDRSEAEDILQEGFIKIFKHLGQYKFSGSFEGWAKRIIVNNAIDYVRRNKNFTISLDETNEYLIPTIQQAEEKGSFENVKAQNILRALHKLSPAYRTVFNMYVLEDMTHKEIANALGISVGTSKSNLFKARKKIKELLL